MFLYVSWLISDLSPKNQVFKEAFISEHRTADFLRARGIGHNEESVELVTQLLDLWNRSQFFSGICGIGHNFWDQFHNLYVTFGIGHRQKIIVE